jgi:hypothetical protein
MIGPANRIVMKSKTGYWSWSWKKIGMTRQMDVIKGAKEGEGTGNLKGRHATSGDMQLLLSPPRCL